MLLLVFTLSIHVHILYMYMILFKILNDIIYQIIIIFVHYYKTLLNIIIMIGNRSATHRYKQNRSSKGQIMFQI